MASIKRIRASDGTANASQATITVLRSPGATSLTVDTVAGIYAGAEGFYASMGTPHTFTDPITAETITVISEASAVDFRGHIDTGHIIIDAIAPGYTDAGSKVGDIVVIRPTTQWGDNVSDTMAVAHNEDGTIKNGAISNNSMFVTALDPVQRAKDAGSNFVVSGCIWTADAAGSTRNASMSSGVVNIGGKRLTVAAITSRLFTPSKDTYVDLTDNGDGTAVPTYAESTNNTASPALTANGMRIAVVVTGATSIAASTSIGQGGFANTVPVISSQVFRGFDSLGNLIYPKGPITPTLAQNPYKFSVHMNGDQTGIADSVTTKVNFDTKKYDTGNNFDTTNHRFVAPVSGFYQINAFIQISSINSTMVASSMYIFKNGLSIQTFGGLYPNVGVGNQVTAFGNFSGLIQLAAGDYLEVYAFGDVISSTLNLTGTSSGCHLSGYLASAS